MSKTLGHGHGLTSFDALRSLKPQDSREWLELKKVDWGSIQSAVTRLFQLRKYPELATELPQLNEKLRRHDVFLTHSQLSQSEVGQFIGEFYQDQILKRCMIILRHELVEETGNQLLSKLAETWTQFYTSILPTLQAIFVPVQLKYLSIRALTLISFRDVVLLKTGIAAALDAPSPTVPPQITQMLLVLQSVHETPPAENYYSLQDLVGRLVKPYICMVPRARGGAKSPSDSQEGSGAALRTSRAETVCDLDGNSTTPAQRQDVNVLRRHSLGGTETT